MNQKNQFLLSIQAGFSAILTYHYCMIEQLMFPNWAIVSALLSFGSDSSSKLSEVLKCSMHRVVGSLIGAYIGLCGHFIIAALITDAFTEIVYIILFMIFSIASYLAMMYEGFRLCLVSSTIVLILTMEDHDPFMISLEYIYSILSGVIIASIIKVVCLGINEYYIKKRIDW
ncbi:MAG TPA: FUSC family protein [Gammaproteobacteria bacterium]|nr:FUSC family protein [Gammaproteobacteria bacterium]